MKRPDRVVDDDDELVGPSMVEERVDKFPGPMAGVEGVAPMGQDRVHVERTDERKGALQPGEGAEEDSQGEIQHEVRGQRRRDHRAQAPPDAPLRARVLVPSRLEAVQDSHAQKPRQDARRQPGVEVEPQGSPSVAGEPGEDADRRRHINRDRGVETQIVLDESSRFPEEIARGVLNTHFGCPPRIGASGLAGQSQRWVYRRGTIGRIRAKGLRSGEFVAEPSTVRSPCRHGAVAARICGALHRPLGRPHQAPA